MDGSEERGNKRLKLQDEGDRISVLPDSLIHHILSFLPSIKQAIQTGILSKRWRNQWSRVPVIIFDFQGHEKEYARFLGNTLLLYDSSKMKKFHIAYNFESDINFTSKILFATRRNVEELNLDFYHPTDDPKEAYMLPKFIFDNASFVDLQIFNCEFELNRRINLPSLKVLKIDCYSLKDSGSIENVVSSSPSLEYLEISFLTSVNPVIIASKSLQILVFAYVNITHDLEISCPNLEELSVKALEMDDQSIFPGKTLLDVLSGSPFLYSLELIYCNCIPQVIASKSLKKLVLGGGYESSTIEVLCPNLEELNWFGSDIENHKLMNFPSSCGVTLDFETPREGYSKNLAGQILVELQRVRNLKVQNWFVKVLSALKMRGLFNPLLNIRCLTLDCPDFVSTLGIVNALRYSPVLETLVIKLLVRDRHRPCRRKVHPDLNSFEEGYWISKGTDFTSLLSHLKTLKIIGLQKWDDKYEVILCFIEFLLKTARGLEKMTVTLKDGEMDFLVKVSQKLLGFPRCSEHAILELFSTCHGRAVVLTC